MISKLRTIGSMTAARAGGLLAMIAAVAIAAPAHAAELDHLRFRHPALGARGRALR